MRAEQLCCMGDFSLCPFCLAAGYTTSLSLPYINKQIASSVWAWRCMSAVGEQGLGVLFLEALRFHNMLGPLFPSILLLLLCLGGLEGLPDSHPLHIMFVTIVVLSSLLCLYGILHLPASSYLCAPVSRMQASLQALASCSIEENLGETCPSLFLSSFCLCYPYGLLGSLPGAILPWGSG